MKKQDIETIDDLRVFLTEWCEQNPDDDCCDLVQEICEENGWRYTGDYEGYDDEDWASDGEKILSSTDDGFTVIYGDGNYTDLEKDAKK